jgi:hypothetical protein
MRFLEDCLHKANNKPIGSKLCAQLGEPCNAKAYWDLIKSAERPMQPSTAPRRDEQAASKELIEEALALTGTSRAGQSRRPTMMNIRSALAQATDHEIAAGFSYARGCLLSINNQFTDAEMCAACGNTPQ